LQDQLKALEAQSARFVKAQQLAGLLRGLLRALHFVLGALTLYFYLNFVLGLYPWTRGFAVWLFALILSPLKTMGNAVLATIPDLIFLVILFFVDVFNEYGVAIMTSSYMADPAEPKLVPKDQWFVPPATPPLRSAPGDLLKQSAH
jgi:hypothetical protein